MDFSNNENLRKSTLNNDVLLDKPVMAAKKKPAKQVGFFDDDDDEDNSKS